MLIDCHATGAPPRLATFAFEASILPCATFHFSAPRECSNTARVSSKRHRSIADVDGEGSGCYQKKKRRLRLELVTSRLSRPYATPTTYIAVKGVTTKVVKRVRPGNGGSSLLRRAAIINWMRIKKAQKYGKSFRSRNTPDQGPALYTESDIEQMEDDGSLRQPHKPPGHSNTHVPRKPSPLGLSNYDAIDLEGDPYDDESWCDVSDDLVNSDFNRREPVDLDEDKFGEFSSGQMDLTTPQPRKSLSEDIMELVTGEDKQQEVSFAQFDNSQTRAVSG